VPATRHANSDSTSVAKINDLGQYRRRVHDVGNPIIVERWIVPHRLLLSGSKGGRLERTCSWHVVFDPRRKRLSVSEKIGGPLEGVRLQGSRPFADPLSVLCSRRRKITPSQMTSPFGFTRDKYGGE
jgi:hypothetical protein